MKMRLIGNIKFVLAVAASFLIAACGSDDKPIDELLATVERGAVLRTISIEGGSWNVTDDTQSVSIELEEQDIEDGDLLQEVRVYADLVDNTSDNIIDPAETLLSTIPSSDFSPGVNGLPRITYSTSLADVASALGIVFGDYNCGDQINLRFEIQLTDGRTITNTDLGGTVAGGSFFSSPLNYRISLIALLPSDTLYTGQYQLTTITPGAFGVADWADGVYTIDAIDNVTRVIRAVPPYPAFGAFTGVDIQFQFVCDEIIFTDEQGTGVGCGGAIGHGSASVNTTFDLLNPDDSDFVINFTSNTDDGGCGTTPTAASFRLTKI